MGWLEGYAKRIALTIDQTKVDSALSDFPVMIHLSVSSGITSADVSAVFDELGSDGNRKKIAVTTDDGTTECTVEIELWDDANEQAWLHVKVPSVAADADTTLYLYYDASAADNTAHVGDTLSAVAQAVWDTNFVAVYHCAQDPSGGSGAVKDSTSNANHGTSQGSMTSDDLVNAKVGKGYDLDGSNDCIELPAGASCKGDAAGTVEALGYVRGTPASNAAIVYESTNTAGYSRQAIFWLTDDNVAFYVRDTETGSSFGATSGGTVSKTAWHYLAGANDSASDVQKLSLDANEPGSNTSSRGAYTDTTPADPIGLGAFTYTSSFRSMNMIIDEVRISQSYRPTAWRKATYYSLFDGLITFGSEEEVSVKIEDLSLDLSASAYAQDDLGSFLRAHDGIEYRNLKSILETVSYIILQDLGGILETVGQDLSSLSILLQAGWNNLKDLASCFEATDGTVFGNLGCLLYVSDGTVERDLGLFLRAVADVPVFKSVTAQKVSAVVHEVSS